MRATIDKDGCLIVEAENELEAFALDKWLDLWNKKSSTLFIGNGVVGEDVTHFEDLSDS